MHHRSSSKRNLQAMPDGEAHTHRKDEEVKMILVIPADGTQPIRRYEASKEPPLQQLQDWVDGYIERVPLFDRWEDLRCNVYANEEGKLRNLPVNERATMAWWVTIGQPVQDMLVGDIVIVANKRRGV